MKSTKQLLEERNMIFFKWLEKKCEGTYAIINRDERLRKSDIWCKYLDKRYEELNNKIASNTKKVYDSFN